jgi:hypothetical protein
VLIRIGEFASWLEDNRTKKLIDYIGEHTWFSNEYCPNSSRNMLKELIYHGHALILLDGLDEIPEVKSRENIVGLVKEFIDEYVKDPNFISAFDDTLFDLAHARCSVAETEAPEKPGGNQIIITGRIVGYETHALTGTFIKHYVLSIINENIVNKFASNWMLNVQEFVHKALLNVGINIDKERSERLTQRRIKAVKSVFKEDQKILFGFSLLSIICTNIFRSSNGFHVNSEIEIFNDVVESAFSFWTKNESIISRELLEVFLLNFSMYLHLKSPSGLMDTFNIKQLARLTVQKQSITKINAKLCEEIADKLLKVLQLNTTIVAERGLEVYGFQHLSYQEYFVAQLLVRRRFTDEKDKREYSLEEIADRFLFHSINPRFRNSLLIALSWINWKWSKDDFNQFCTVLVRSNKSYSIPLGAILLFNSWNHLQTLPSESVIFTALNRLLDSPVSLITKIYLIPYLCKLPENIIQTWMSNYLNNKKSLSKFCQYLLKQFKCGIQSCTELATESFIETDSDFTADFDVKFHMEAYMEFDTESSTDSLGRLRLPDLRRRKSNLSVICKQLYSFYNENISNTFVINQTLQRIMLLAKADDDVSVYQWISTSENEIPVSIIHPLILSLFIMVSGGVILELKYKPNGVSWSIRRMYHKSTIIEALIKYVTHENQWDSNIVDILISQYTTDIEKASTSDISDHIVDTFVALICLQNISHIVFNEKYLKYKALSMALEKIKQTFFYITTMFYEKYCFYRKHVEASFKETIQLIINKFNLSSDQYDQQNSTYVTHDFILKKLSIQWSLESFSNHDDHDDLESVLKFYNFPQEKWEPIQEDFPNEPPSLLTFVPLSLQKLYYHLFINRTDETDSLPLVVFLAQYSIYLKDVNITDPNFESQCKEHFLENYLFALLKATEEFTSFDNWNKLIDIECERISEANKLQESQYKDYRLFAASISLARLSHIQQCSTLDTSTTNNNLSSFSSEAIENISDPILRIIAWDFILEIEGSFISQEKQRDDLDLKIIRLLEDTQNIPLLTLTFMIVRFYKQRKDFQMICLIIKMIGEKFGKTQIDRDTREAVSIALKHCGHLDYLSKLFDPTQWNSSLLFRNFKQTSFESLDHTFLSFIYITELGFDAHVLQVYKNNEIFGLQRLLSQEIDSSNNKKILTYEAARWITNYLEETWNEYVLDKVISAVFECLTVEEKALTIIQEWCLYRYENKLKIFAQYAALQLFIKGSNHLDLIEIINEILCTDDDDRLNYLIEHIFNSETNDITILSQILKRWQRNHYYSSKISIWIRSKKILHLIFELEYQQITQIPFNSLLFLIKGCSFDLQVEVKRYLQTFIEQTDEINEQYVANIIKWIIECNIWNNSNEEFYNYLFSFFDHQSYHYVQKTILITLHSVLKQFSWKNENHALISHLEKIIVSYSQYPEDVLAVCLLTYGIYLYKLKDCHLSDGIQEILTKLFTQGSTKVISSRASLCLIIIEEYNEWFIEIPNWFKEKWSLTDDDEYNLLLQQTLFSDMKISYLSDKILDKFICELNRDLDNKCSTNYSSDSSPNYIQIANYFNTRDFKRFQSALKKNAINENKLKTKLYMCAKYAKLSTDYEAAVEFYASFGILTEELYEMLAWSEDRYTGYIPIHLQNIKDVSNREVIESLFNKFESLLNNGKFNVGIVILRLLIELGKADIVASIDIHQQVTKIIEQLSNKNKLPDWFCKDSIFDSLLSLSNVREGTSMDNLEDHRNRIKLFSAIDIDFEFEKKIKQMKYLSTN